MFWDPSTSFKTERSRCELATFPHFVGFLLVANYSICAEKNILLQNRPAGGQGETSRGVRGSGQPVGQQATGGKYFNCQKGTKFEKWYLI